MSPSIRLLLFDYPQNRDPSILGDLRRAGVEPEVVRLTGHAALIEALHAGHFDVILAWPDSLNAKGLSDFKELTEEHRIVVENIPDTVRIADETGKTLFISPKVRDLLGFSPEELRLGKTIWFDRVHPEDLERLHIAYARLFEFGTSMDLEYRMRRKDDTLIWVHHRSVLIVAAGGAKRACSILSDITERKRLENRLRQAQKMETIGELAEGIVHDFKNVLGSVLGYVQMALSTVPEGTQAHADLLQALKAGGRARELTAQLLSFGKNPDTPVPREPHHLDVLIKDSIRLLKPLISPTIGVEVNLEPSLPLVLCDTTQMHQVLMNLCINASHAMPQGGKLRISLRRAQGRELDEVFKSKSSRRKDHLVLSVEDTGTGIPPDVLPKIFEPFFTTKGDKNGSGLGLAVVNDIVQSHEGKITVQSQPGKGTAFHVYLPSTVRTGDTMLFQRVPRRSILIVDDDRQLARMLAEALHTLGYGVLVEHDGDRALAAFRAEPNKFSLVILDEVMPGLDGLAVASEMAKLRPDVPILLHTGFAERVNEEVAHENGITRILDKPIGLDKLELEIREVLHEVA